MGNEYGAADFQPHLIPAMVYERVIDLEQVAGTTTVIVAGGYHPKMRLRYAHWTVVDAVIAVDNGVERFNLLHGSNAAIDSAHPSTDGDVIGTIDELDIVDQYKDVAAADQVAIEVEVQATDTGTVKARYLGHFEYELVE